VRFASGAIVCLFVAACRADPAGQQQQQRFPDAHRPVAPIVSDRFSTEDTRDRLGESEQVMKLAGIAPGMWVADIGAGEGYYTVRLAPVVGPRGRVLAQDIVPATRDLLADRVQRERLDNVAVRLGKPDDPLLPPRSFDRILLIHMYHEVESPYAFLWHLRDGLKPDGEIVVVDSNRPTKRHGIPPALLRCEFAALGLEPVRMSLLAGGEAYYAAFRFVRPRPRPDEIKACSN
jgi:predicted methyltransferase